NSLPVRARVAEEEETVGWLKRLQREQVDAREYEYTPLAKAQGWSDVPGGLPLFESLMVFENYPVDASLQAYVKRAAGLELVELSVVEKGTDPLIFTVVNGERLYLRLTYDAGRFDKATITRTMGHIKTLLKEMSRKPDRRVSELGLLTEAERHQLLVEWPGLSAALNSGMRVDQLFEAQVERTPDATAVVFKDQEISYRTLNRRANQLAHHLRRLGVGPEARVGVCVERSVEMIVALFGVLKAGGAYVPVDPAYPKRRIAFMLEDSAAQVLLTEEKFVKRLPAGDARLLRIDSDWDVVAREGEENPVTRTAAQNLAYQIYTSGSTGEPKGVMVEHASLANYAEAAGDEFELRPGDRVLQFATISFDTSAEEIYPCLTRGATLVLRTDSMLESTALFLDKCREWAVSVLDLPTAYWHELVYGMSAEGLELPPSVRLVVIGGEKANQEKLASWREHVNRPVRLLNGYGPTEATIVATMSDLSLTSQDRRAFPEATIGSAIRNAQVYILDSRMRPCPVGVPGEIHIGGAGVSRGYQNRPDLTAEMFIPNPFGGDAGARLYKTGDRGRYLSDGNIRFIDRLDNQVKVRGFRVELGEIVSRLKEHQAVREAEVLAREDKPGSKRLVAYVVPAPQSADSDEQSPGAELPVEQVSQWGEVFEDLFREKDPGHESTFYIKGWNSSYTDLPIPGEEVSEWMNQTVDRILPLRPTQVFEIGCGSGLMLFRVAPHCERYHATDLSKNILSILESQLAETEVALPEVALFQRSADNFEGIEANSFDAVLMVSVIQYFPGVRYLLRVLEQAVDAVRPGGFIYLGDVRSLPLLEAFHASVQLFRASPSLTKAELRQRVKNHLLAEKQLVIDPDFFIALEERLPKISHAEIQLMRGRYHNELTKFRYDVVLHVGDDEPASPDIDWLDWREQGLTTSSVRRLLLDKGPDLLGLAGVPLARVMRDLQAVEILSGEDGPETVGELRDALSRLGSDAVDPEDMWRLGDELPYSVNITWSNAPRHDCFDVVFRRREAAGAASPWNKDIRISKKTVAPRPWEEYANDPTQGTYASRLVPRLQEFLKERLPDYMMPSAFVILDSMPLMPNGKVDLQSLASQDGKAAGSKEDFLAPRDPVEEVVAAIWSEVLGHDQIGIYDNFFDLGGHSLLATQIISRLRLAFNFEVPIHSLFDVPNVAGLAEKIKATRLSQQGLQPTAITPSSRDGELPLSFAQQRLWFINQMETGSSAYNVPYAVRLTGPLNVAALGRSLSEIIRRHEVLRTTFVSLKGRPRQVIAEAGPLSLPTVDLSDMRRDDREAEAQRLTAEEASLGFDLSRGPLLRVKLIRLKEAENVVLLTLHHIVSDGWSIGVLVREVSALYEAYGKGEESTLPELRIQYADFAKWQREWLQGEVLDKQMRYWREKLKGPLPVLELPTDRPRPLIQTYRGRSEVMTLSSDLGASLKRLSRRHGCTMFMTMLAGFQVLLYRYTGEEDILMGTPIAGRNMTETEALIGFFVNTLVMRTDLGGNPGFVEVMGRARETALGAYAHQDVPFEKLVAELQPERDLSRSPLFQVMLTLQNVTGEELKISGARVTGVGVDSSVTKFDIVMSITEREDELQGVITYNTDLFDESTIKRMADHFMVLMGHVAVNEGGKVSDIEILSEQERRQVLVEWNDTAAVYPDRQCAHEIFAAQARLTPHAVAVIDGERALSYCQLDERANHLARRLRRLGVGPEARVGVHVERGLEMVIGLLGTLKAGGVYVPLATSYPEDRVGFMIGDAEVSVLLTQQHLAERLPDHSARVICLDADAEVVPDEDRGEIESGVDPRNLAYAIYTS
ncbi:MAG TPA: amino acid adenylation domain-containing protein, partial [Blastocatellia bacterium]|nr:amino acid adenylation domain-containing protein [Blastocatellia bacterium]